jgi:hypothetical protein
VRGATAGDRIAARAGNGQTGGAAGNERLTAAVGAVLLVLLVGEGLTILSIRGLITAHFFIGMLLIGPVCLKIATTSYRFARYYMGAPEYRRKGAPALPLRLLGPVVMASTAAVIGSGVMLAVAGPGRSIWLLAHKASFVIWFGAMTVHVLAYAPRLPRLLTGELGGRTRNVLAGRGLRCAVITMSLLAGLVIAAMTAHLSGPWRTVWLGG